MTYTFKLIDRHGTFNRSQRIHREIPEPQFQRYASDEQKRSLKINPTGGTMGDRWYAYKDGEWVGTVCIWKTSDDAKYTLTGDAGLRGGSYFLTTDSDGLNELFEQWWLTQYGPPEPPDPGLKYEIWD